MKQNQFNRIGNKSKPSWIKFSVSVFLIVVVIPLGMSNFKAFKSFWTSLKELKNTEANLSSLVDREEKLNKELVSFKSEYGVEKEIREKFPVAKDGEEVIIFVDSKGEGGEASSSPNAGFWNEFKERLGF